MKLIFALLCSLVLFFGIGGVATQYVAAQTSSIPTVDESTASESIVPLESASTSGSLASPSAEIEQKIQDQRDRDITVTDGVKKSVLASHLDKNPPGPLSWNNVIQHAIRYSVGEGVPANVIVIVLLFPLVASLIAASRHIIGLRGFGIYIPTVLSVALVSTGILGGMMIFSAIVITAVLTKQLLKKMKISYLPRTALLLSTISMGIFGLILAAPYFNLVNLMSVNIFPILILVLLAENFLDAQSRSKQSEAFALTAETIGLAVISSLILQWEFLQKTALLEPELLIICIFLFNILIGKFSGLRLSEWLRFRSIIEE